MPAQGRARSEACPRASPQFRHRWQRGPAPRQAAGARHSPRPATHRPSAGRIAPGSFVGGTTASGRD
eukprot:5472184-Lingulodinium_polyedra.AAC.1